MKLLAWLYLKAPMWMMNLVPDSINYAESGRFNEAVEASYNRWANRANRRANRKTRRTA